MFLLERFKKKISRRGDEDLGDVPCDLDADCSPKSLAMSTYEPPVHIPTPTTAANMTHHPLNLLPLVGVPLAYTRKFVDLNGAVILYFGPVLSVGGGASKERVVIVSDQCIYTCDLNGSVLRCLAIQSIMKLYNHSLHMGVHMEDSYDLAIEFPNEEELASFALVVVTVHSKMVTSKTALKVDVVSKEDLFELLSFTKPKGEAAGKEVAPITRLEGLFQNYETLSLQGKRAPSVRASSFKRRRRTSFAVSKSSSSNNVFNSSSNTVEVIGVLEMPRGRSFSDIPFPASLAEMTHHPLTLLPLVSVPSEYMKKFSGLSKSALLYFNGVKKLNAKGAEKERVLVISDKAVYVLQNTAVVTRCINIALIAKLCTERRRLGIVVKDGYDFACDFDTPEEAARVVDILVRVYSKIRTVRTPLRVEQTHAPTILSALNFTKPKDFEFRLATISLLDTIYKNYETLSAQGRRMSLKKPDSFQT